MSKQYFELLEGIERQNGDIIHAVPRGSLHEHPRFVTFRPVDPEPTNPWIKGSERMPSREDVTSDGGVFYWDDVAKEAFVCNWGEIEPHNYWRKVDQTPPPTEPEPEPTPEIHHLRHLVSSVKENKELPEVLRRLGDLAEAHLNEIEVRDAWLRKVLFEWFDFFAMAESAGYCSEHQGNVVHKFKSEEETAAAFESFLKLIAHVTALRESEGRDE